MRPIFDGNRRKAASNRRKHGVSFEEALTVFADPLARIFEDEDHSDEERREIIIGHSKAQRLLVVCFAEGRDSIRSGRIMKKTSNRRTTRAQRDEMRRGYRFNYRKARPNRFASRFQAGAVAVVLDPDVASVSRSPASVNA
jgi:uncharacterized DUF497 family protein